MGADKNASRRMNSTYVTNSQPMVPTRVSHNRPTNLRNKPQLKAARKRNSRRKGLSSSTRHQADGPRAPGGPSARPRRIVRRHRADYPKMTLEPPVLHPQNSDRLWRHRGPSVRKPAHTDCPWTPRGPSAKHSTTKNS
jgi:hypothetical protein